jgi:hypothetical protein
MCFMTSPTFWENASVIGRPSAYEQLFIAIRAHTRRDVHLVVVLHDPTALLKLAVDLLPGFLFGCESHAFILRRNPLPLQAAQATSDRILTGSSAGSKNGRNIRQDTGLGQDERRVAEGELGCPPMRTDVPG